MKYIIVKSVQLNHYEDKPISDNNIIMYYSWEVNFGLFNLKIVCKPYKIFVSEYLNRNLLVFYDN